MSKTAVPCGTAADSDMLRLARVEMWHVLCLSNHLMTVIWNELSPARRNKLSQVLHIQSRDISIRHFQKNCAKCLPPLCTLSTGKLDAGRAFGQ